MKRTVITLAAASVLAAALPALAGQPIGWFDERYPIETNKARQAFPNPPPGSQSSTQPPYALTGTSEAAAPSQGWQVSQETIGLYPRTIYRR
jgi:hypothetical protein